MKLANIGFRILVAGLLIWFLVDAVDFRLLDDRIRDVDMLYIVLGTLVVLAMTFVGGARWIIVIRALGGPLEVRRQVSIFWIGTAFGQVLPALVGGDAVRMWLAWRHGYGARLSINSVIIERILLMVVLVFLVLFVSRFWASRIGDVIPGWAPWLAAGVTVLVLIGLSFVGAIVRRFDSWLWLQSLLSVSTDLQRVYRSGWTLIHTLANSLINHLLVAFAAFLFSLALGLQIGLIDCLIFIPPVILISTLPISFAGWGVREGAIVALFGAISGDPTTALLVSILLGLSSALCSLPGLFLWIMTTPKKERRINLSDLKGGAAD